MFFPLTHAMKMSLPAPFTILRMVFPSCLFGWGLGGASQCRELHPDPFLTCVIPERDWVLKSFGFEWSLHFSLFFVCAGLCCFVLLASSSCREQGLLLVMEPRLLLGVASLAAERWLQAHGLQWLHVCSGPCGVFLDQGWQPWSLVSTRMNSLLLQLEQFRASIQSVHIHPGVNSMRTPTNRNKHIG